MNSEGPNNPRVTIAVTRQLNQLRNKVPDGVKIIINDTDIFDIQAELYGPIKTPYEGGVFKMKLVLPQDFPKTPPKGYFITRIFHPNVSEKGEICVNTLKKDWNPQNWAFYHIFEVIKCLLIIPFPESALNEEAGKLFMEDYDSYFKYAKLMTDVHAKPKITNKMEIEKEEKESEEQGQKEKSMNMQYQTQMSSDSQQIQDNNSQKLYKSDNMNNSKIITNPQEQLQQQQIQQSLQQQQSQLIQQNIQQQNTTTNNNNSLGQGQLNLPQTTQFNPITASFQVNSPYRDINKPQLINNSQFLNSSSFSKNQNQENLQYQSHTSFITGNNLSNPGLLNTSFIQEEPLCALSKNNGYYSNTTTTATGTSISSTANLNNISGNNNSFKQSSQQQQQQQQQFNKNNVLLNLTFNNYAAGGQSSFVTTNNTNNSNFNNNGKQQNEKKKWLKRI